MRRASPWVVFLVAIWGVAAPAEAVTYDVGPGQPLGSVGEVPWESLEAGDLVRIHWRAEPYREKWVIARRGTEAAPIVVQGVRGPSGERPVIDGRDATTRTALSFWNEPRGVIKIGGASAPADTLPAWIVIEGLEIRSGRAPYGFTDDSGSGQTYADNAASIYVEKAEHLTIRDCVLHDSGNGLFIGAFEGMTRDVLVEGNHLYDNGIVGSIYEHNSYTAAIGITFHGNHYGPLRDGAGGNNLKDRSAGLVVRYNWIEGGNRQLDLVDGEDTSAVSGARSYRDTYVYGNVLVEHDGEGNRQIVHYGGDSGDTSIYRKGRLWFFHNTVVSTRTGRTTLLRLSTDEETARVRNNVIYVTADGGQLSLLDGAGVLELRSNFLKPGWVATFGTLTGSLDDDGSSVEAASAGFVDAAAGDYHLAAGSPCVDAGSALPASLLPDHAVERQYVRHAGDEARPVEGALDLGAFERCEGSCSPPPADGGTADGGAALDAGPAGLDAGGATADGGIPGVDGGGAGTDGAVGAGDDEATVDGGCGCRAGSGGGASPPLVALAVLWWMARRRRAVSSRRGSPATWRRRG